MKKPRGSSIAKCSLCHVHAFTLKIFRRKEFGGFLSDPSKGIRSFGNGEANPEHLPNHILDVAGTITEYVLWGDDRSGQAHEVSTRYNFGRKENNRTKLIEEHDCTYLKAV